MKAIEYILNTVSTKAMKNKPDRIFYGDKIYTATRGRWMLDVRQYQDGTSDATLWLLNHETREKSAVAYIAIRDNGRRYNCTLPTTERDARDVIAPLVKYFGFSNLTINSDGFTYAA